VGCPSCRVLFGIAVTWLPILYTISLFFFLPESEEEVEGSALAPRI
jgi:hypothetical protein